MRHAARSLFDLTTSAAASLQCFPMAWELEILGENGYQDCPPLESVGATR